MKKFEIILQNKKLKIYYTISWLIVAVNFITFLYMGSAQSKNMLIPFTGAGLLLIVFIFQRVYKKKKENKFDLPFGIIIITWLFLQQYWPALFNLLLYSLYSITARPFVVIIGEAGITYPSFPKKTFSWSDLNNIILKDGLLTIDFKSNRFIQQLTDSKHGTVDEAEFNDFCKGYLQERA